MYRYFLGVDPDVQGCLAVIDQQTGEIKLFDIPTMEIFGKACNKNVPLLREIYDLLAPYSFGSFATIEQQQPWRTDTPFTAGSLMYSMGVWEMALVILGIPFLKVLPTEWKPEMMHGMGGLKAKKPANILKARTLFPSVTDQLSVFEKHGRADSLLIMEFGRRKYVSEKKA